MQVQHLNPNPAAVPSEVSRRLHGEPELARVRPRANVAENDDRYGLELLVPGASKEALSISAEKGVLTVEARGGLQRPDGMRHHTEEFSAVQYGRRFRLPDDVDVEAITAQLDAGILTLVLPKRESAKPHTIAVS